MKEVACFLGPQRGFAGLGCAANEDIGSTAGAEVGDFAEQIIQFN